MAARGQDARARSAHARRKQRTARAAGLARLGVVVVLLVVGAVAAWHVFHGGGAGAAGATSATQGRFGNEGSYEVRISEQAKAFSTPPELVGSLPSATGRNPWRLGAAVLNAVPVTDVVVGAGGSVNAIALTFDDGPSPFTAQVVKTLARYKAHATFFMLGREIKAHPDAVREVLAGGNAIGDHTWSHSDLRRLSVKERRDEIVGTAQQLNTTGSPTPTLVRPPYGSTNPTINRFIRSLGMLPVNWNVDPDDWKVNPVPSVDAIVAGVVDNVKPGSIVLMHDGGGDRTNTVAALPRILAILRNRGIRVVTVPQLLKQSPPGADKLLSSY
jgi:peptidoglycan/xylan/chitin deacetylase (PgdA/CDA1 family)